MARDGDFPSESAGVQFGCVLSDLFPFLSVVARPGSMVNGSMFASLVRLGALLGLTVGNFVILAQVKWNQFHLALDYDSIENDLAHLRFPGMKVVRLGFL